jgi:hypothetical protein
MSDKLMRFDPATGEERPYPSHAAQWREWHGVMAWLFNPWTGERRHASDVGSDPYGLLILPDGESLKAAPEPATVPVNREALEALRAALQKCEEIWDMAISQKVSRRKLSAANNEVLRAAFRLIRGDE